MKVAIAADHAGWELKERLRQVLGEQGHEVIDLGTDGPEAVDYPDFGAACGRAVSDGEAERGVLVCGSGIGIAMAAGKVPGVRAATCHDLLTTELCRKHVDANVLAIGARVVDAELAEAMVSSFLATEFEGGRHAPRVAKLDLLDGATASEDEER